MAGYKRPKVRLHKDFLYLNHDSVINALSAIEAGKVDEIIEKVSDSADRAFEAGVAAGPARLAGSRKKQAGVQAELVRTRTRFSAFEAWHQYLKGQEALGALDGWNRQIREQLVVGDTLEFTADLTVAPLHKVITNYQAFVAEAAKPGSLFAFKGPQLTEARRAATVMGGWIAGPTGKPSVPAYLSPNGVSDPLVVARLSSEYLVGNLADAEGQFKVVGQVARMLSADEQVAAVRMFREVPATPLEVNTMTEALRNMIEPAKGLGVEITEADLTIGHPAVILNPIAIYK